MISRRIYAGYSRKQEYNLPNYGLNTFWLFRKEALLK